MAHMVLKDFYLNGAMLSIGSKVEEFLGILDRILSQMAKFNVRLKSSRRFFGMTEIEFLGHIFDVSGVQLSDERVQGIRESPEPTFAKEKVRSFIGIVN